MNRERCFFFNRFFSFLKNKIQLICERAIKKDRQKIKISIVIPCFNSKNTIISTLKSVQKQTYKNLDVLIIDDGSEEKVEDIVASFSDRRFRYFWRENVGLGLSRNFGINNAEGEFISFLDSDDALEANALFDLLSYALSNKLDVVSGVTVRKIFQTGVENEWYRNLYKKNYINTLDERLELFDDGLTTNKLYRVNVLKEKNIYFEEGLYEDKLFTVKLYTKIDRIGIISNRVYTWFVYGDSTSISTSKNIANFKERMLTINKLWAYLPELRKVYQLAYYMNHDLLIYLREFLHYTEKEKSEIYECARVFIQKYEHYVYKRLVPISLHRACLDALCVGDKNKFIYTANILSQTYQDASRLH